MIGLIGGGRSLHMDKDKCVHVFDACRHALAHMRHTMQPNTRIYIHTEALVHTSLFRALYIRTRESIPGCMLTWTTCVPIKYLTIILPSKINVMRVNGNMSYPSIRNSQLVTTPRNHETSKRPYLRLPL